MSIASNTAAPPQIKINSTPLKVAGTSIFFGRCEQSTGIDPFARLVAQVMTQRPHRDARRAFWIMDNGASHRWQPCVRHRAADARGL